MSSNKKNKVILEELTIPKENNTIKRYFDKGSKNEILLDVEIDLRIKFSC